MTKNREPSVTGDYSDNEPVKSGEESKRNSPRRKRKKSGKHISKKKHRKRRRTLSSSSSTTSSSPSSSSSSGSDDNDKGPKRFTITTTSKEREWKLRKEMTTYVNEKFTEYIPEKDIEEAILVENPVTQNIKRPKKLDEFLKQLVNTNSTLLAGDVECVKKFTFFFISVFYISYAFRI